MKKVLILVSVIALFLVGCKQKESNEVTIGAIFPMTGYGASNGQTCQQGLNLAIDSLNKMQEKYVYKVIYEDCKSTAKDASMAYKRLQSQGVKYFIGFGGPFLVGFTPDTNDKEEILFAVGTPNMDFLSLSNRAFRVYPTAEMVVDVIMKFLSEKQLNNAALVYLHNEAYLNYRDIFQEKMSSVGNSVVYTEGYEVTTKDFKNIINKIAAQQPDLVYLAGTGESTAIFIRQMFANPQTESIPIIGDMSLSNSDNLRLIGDIRHPIYIVDSYITPDYISAYKERYDEIPNGFQAFVGTVPFILDKALNNNAADAKVSQIYNFIKNDTISSITGTISFSEETREPNLNLYVREVTSVN